MTGSAIKTVIALALWKILLSSDWGSAPMWRRQIPLPCDFIGRRREAMVRSNPRAMLPNGLSREAACTGEFRRTHVKRKGEIRISRRRAS